MLAFAAAGLGSKRCCRSSLIMADVKAGETAPTQTNMGYAGSYEGEAIRACTHPCSRTDPPAPTSRQALFGGARNSGRSEDFGPAFHLHVRAHGDTDYHVCMGRPYSRQL